MFSASFGASCSSFHSKRAIARYVTHDTLLDIIYLHIYIFIYTHINKHKLQMNNIYSLNTIRRFVAMNASRLLMSLSIFIFSLPLSTCSARFHGAHRNSVDFSSFSIFVCILVRMYGKNRKR